MTRYMLDTNIVSYLAKGTYPRIRQHLSDLRDDEEACISAITEAELLYSLARRPQAVHLHRAIHALLANLVILPWTSTAPSTYAELRARNEALGVTVGNLDLLIAAHALAEAAILVTNDKDFSQLSGHPKLVNWT